MFGKYISSGQGAVDTIRLQNGRTVQVSAVDGDSPYIVARSNPGKACTQSTDCPEGEACLYGDGSPRCVEKKTGFPVYFVTMGVLFAGSIWGGYRLGKRLPFLF